MEDYHKKGGISRMNQLTPEEKSELGKKAYQEKINPSIPRETHFGILKIGDKEIACSVVKDSEGNVHRLLSMKDVLKALGRGKIGGSDRKRAEVAKLPVFLSANNLKPFMSNEIVKWGSPVQYRKKDGRKMKGFDYRVLTSTCETYLKARDVRDTLTRDQIDLAKSCEILMRSFAQVGLVSLIDEVSGYQEVRDKFALQAILDKYLRKEFAEWAKRFPPSFYEQIFRLNNWKFAEISTKKPMIIGKYTNDIVYSRLLPELVDELQSRNPKNELGYRETRHHQWLSDIGHIDLDRHISAVTALMKCCRDWKEFKDLLGKVYPVKSAKDILIKE